MIILLDVLHFRITLITGKLILKVFFIIIVYIKKKKRKKESSKTHFNAAVTKSIRNIPEQNACVFP